MIVPATRLVRSVLLAVLFVGIGAAGGAAAQQQETIVASGKLESRFLAGSLFHIDEFWIRVTAGTEFNRWLSQGLKHNAVVLLTGNPERFADQKDVRILTGLLHHETAPKPTPVTTDVVGRLPQGDSGLVHVLFVQDEQTGILSTVMLETADRFVVSQFEKFEGARVSIVIAIETGEKSRKR